MTFRSVRRPLFASLAAAALAGAAFAQSEPAQGEPSRDVPEARPASPAEQGTPALTGTAPQPVPATAVPPQPAKPGAKQSAAPAKPAAPAPELVPLAFMTGNWTQQQPRGAVIEEHWMPVRGNSMLGSFRRVLGNGVVPFYEFTQIVVEKGEVLLRQIHVHGNFEPDPKRTEAMVLRLVKAGDNSATFEPAGDEEKSHAGEIDRVTYTLKDADTLELRVIAKGPPAKEGERPAAPQELVFTMTRER